MGVNKEDVQGGFDRSDLENQPRKEQNDALKLDFDDELKEILMQKTFRCLVLILAVNSIANAVIISPTNSNIRYVGRWNFDNPEVPWVYWQGSSIIVNFKGTGISIDIDAGTKKGQYRVVIDGVPEADRRYFSNKRKKYPLASGLTDGIHKLEIMKETRSGNSQFYGFEVTGAGLVAPPPRPALRIEFFGDSNMDGTSNYSEKDSGDMGTYYAFPAMVSRMLGAEMHNESVSGAQIDDAGDNCVGSFIFSEDYDNQNPNYRSGFDPHIIVINAGANDMYSVSKTTIKNRFKAVIADLRTVYGPTPHIVLMNAYGWATSEPANYTQEVVDEVGGNLSALHYAWLWEQYHGCQWDHSGEAHQLVEHLESINRAWVQVRPNDIIDGFGRNWDFANGSFEHKAPFGSFGWRYYTDGVERVKDSAGAADGDYYIRLDSGEMVHQPTDATGDLLPGGTSASQTYYITASIRGTEPGAQAQIQTHFEGQTMWTHDDNPATFQTSTFDLTTSWKDYTHVATASTGVWTIFNYLIASSGTVEFDNVRMSNKPIICGNSGICGFDDLISMAENWLSSDSLSDIAPVPSGDGIVNNLDFGMLSEYWNPSTL